MQSVGHSRPFYNICAWDGALPVLYHECSDYYCAAYNYVDYDGASYGRDDWCRECGLYRQMRTTFFTSLNMPFICVAL